MKKEISIILPIHNEKDSLPIMIRLLNSSIKFTKEIIIVYDTEKENALNVAKELSEEFENVKLIHNALNEFYEEEAFIIVLPIGEIPATHHVTGSNFCHIGVVQDNNPNRCILFSVIDNLVKGSSGQAIQNANISFGFEETTGLWECPIFP